MLVHLTNTAIQNFMSTGIAFLLVLIIYFVINIIFVRKIDQAKRRKKVKIRTFYVAALVFLFFMARIWVDGFMHLIAVLGLVSAGLVVTNKETIMNLVGWLIITWRGVFSEDDLIQIQQYRGYVKSIGLLYISLQEVSDSDFSRITGKEIKVPNGLTANNAVINYSQTARLILFEFKLPLTAKLLKESQAKILNCAKKVLTEFYKENKSYNVQALVRFDHSLKNKVDLNPRLIIGDTFDSEKPLSCAITYYCFVEDRQAIVALLTQKLENLF